MMTPIKKQTYEEFQMDEALRNEAIRLFEVGQIQAKKLSIDALSPTNFALNLCFNRLIFSDLIKRVVALEKYVEGFEKSVKDLESKVDGNRFTNGSDL